MDPTSLLGQLDSLQQCFQDFTKEVRNAVAGQYAKADFRTLEERILQSQGTPINKVVLPKIHKDFVADARTLTALEHPEKVIAHDAVARATVSFIHDMLRDAMVGHVYQWEPHSPFSACFCVVVDVRWNGEEFWVHTRAVTTDGQPVAYRPTLRVLGGMVVGNELTRFLEAIAHRKKTDGPQPDTRQGGQPVDQPAPGQPAADQRESPERPDGPGAV